MFNAFRSRCSHAIHSLLVALTVTVSLSICRHSVPRWAAHWAGEGESPQDGAGTRRWTIDSSSGISLLSIAAGENFAEPLRPRGRFSVL